MTCKELELKAFGAQAHFKLLRVYDVGADKRRSPVRGALGARGALDELLRGAEFEAAYISASEVRIRRAGTSTHGERAPVGVRSKKGEL